MVSDAILDALYKKDPNSRVAVETLTTTGLIVVAGEITTTAYIDVQNVVRNALKKIGYDKPEYGFNADDCSVLVSLHEQSPDISQGVTEGQGDDKEQGAGDQGLIFGYATNETESYMPLPIYLAHKLTQKLSEVRRNNELTFLRPDGKSQVTVEYEDGKPKRIDTVVVSAHHADIPIEQVRRGIKEKVIKPVCGGMMDENTKVYINPTGRFVKGGPPGDTGVTGRKIIVDTYGGHGSHGGGAFCITGDALVNTENGLLQLSDIKDCRDMLVKTDFSPTKAEQWFYNGEMETIKVVTNDGYRLEGTNNQCIRVIDKNGNYVWRRLDQLKPNDWLAIQRKNRMFGQRVDTSDFAFSHKPSAYRKNIFTFPKELTEDYAYLLGLLIGDGNCMMDGGIAICICEEEQKNNVQKLYRHLFGKPGKIFGHWTFFGGIELRAYLKHLGLGKYRSWEKTIPKSVLKAPKEVVAAFLRGLFDTDGTIRFTGRTGKSLDIKLTSTSLDLIRGIQMLLLNFGIVSNIQTVNTVGKKSKIGGREVTSKRLLYHLRLKGSESWRIFKQEIGFGLSRKANILISANLDTPKRLVVPNQRQRIIRLWKKLTSQEHQHDKAKIGRLTRSIHGKATKELTYSKLCEFLDAYESCLQGNSDFEYLRTLYILRHHYTQIRSLEKSMASVFDITVPGAHTFTANGFVCHNSGKDPSKVDRSASYMARHITKNIVAAGLADKCEIQIAYAIGVAQPVSVFVNTYGTSKIPEEKIEEIVKKVFDLRPKAIIEYLNLRRPIYTKTVNGHFGSDDPDFTWEKTNRVEELRKEAGI